MSLTAVLVDDHQLFREGLKRLFELHGHPKVVGEASDAAGACELVDATRPDVVVLDMVLADGASGIDVARRLLERERHRILFLSMVKDPARVAGALQTGALGYATKDQSAEDLFEAVTTVAAGKPYVAPSLTAGAASAETALPDLSSLTARERQVFDLTVAGLTSRGVGERLGISARTVETHRVRILRKLGAASATDLVRIAARAGLLG